MRDSTVPKSLDVQRTKAKMLPGVKDRTRRLRAKIRSETGRPNRIRFSIRFSSHNSSTVVRSFTLDLHVVEPPGHAMRRRCSALFPKLEAGHWCRELLWDCRSNKSGR